MNKIPRFFFLLPGTCYLAEFFVWRSFPQSHTLNGFLGGLWTAGQVGILLILSHLYGQKMTGKGGWRILGPFIAGAGAVSYTINYVFGYWLNMNTKVFLPMGALLTGIGMLVTGIQVLVAKRWTGSAKLHPLLVGLYPFVVMLPLLVITGHPNLVAIMCWGIPWLMLGFSLSIEEHMTTGLV